MKMYIWLLLLIAINGVSIAQNKVLERGSRISDDRLHAVAGTWTGSDGTDSLKVELWVEECHVESLDIYVDMLFGKYAYWKDGKLKESSDDVEYETMASGLIVEEGPPIYFVLDFYNQQGMGNITLELDSADDTLASWHLRPRGHEITIDGRVISARARFDLPERMTLKKLITKR